MGKVIIPKHTAELVYFDSALQILVEAQDWVLMGDFTDRLFKHLKKIGKEESRHSDNTHYTKCAQLPLYFGFAQRNVIAGKTYLKVTPEGVRFYSACLAHDSAAIHLAILDSMEKGGFGEGNDGVPSSRTDVDAPNLFVRASYDLNGLSNKEFAYLLWSLVDKNDDYTGSIEAIKHGRDAGGLSLPHAASNYQDCKPIMILNRWGFLSQGPNGLIVNPQLDSAYHNRLLSLKIYSIDRNVFGIDKKANGQAQRQLSETLGADLLDSALRQFKAHRSDPEWAGRKGEDDWTSYTVNTATREYFGKLDEAKVRAFDEAAFTELFCGVKDGTGKVTFSPMWSGNPGQGWSHVKKAYEADAAKVIGFLADLAGSPAMSALFARDGFERPGGFGKSVVSELLMKFHPDCCFKYGSKTADVFKRLGLLDFEPRADYGDTEYKRILGIAATIRDKMAALEISQTLDNELPPDFLTVNEFVGWAFEQGDSVYRRYKEEVMAKEFRKVDRKPKKDGVKKLSDMMQDPLLKRLAAALRTKPFAILAGHSGTGKSQTVRRLAYMTCADEGLMAEAETKNAPGNYCMIQVRPNWHDSTDLLGYYSEMGGRYRTTPFVEFVMKAYAYPDIPFFACLDEMNLAPVEQYFAEYLSAIESASVKGGAYLTDALIPKDHPADEIAKTEDARFTESKAWFEAHGLTLPKNLFVVGTVNMDDTTCQFSRKVLDRAMTIMMDQVRFEDMMSADRGAEPGAGDLLRPEDVAQFLGGKLRSGPLTTHQVSLLNAIEGVLGKTPFAVAYRFANEYALYEASLTALTGKASDETLAKEAMDHCVLMKVLPRIHGEKRELESLFRGGEGGKGLESVLDKDTTLSGRKMEEILARSAAYLSFWP